MRCCTDRLRRIPLCALVSRLLGALAALGTGLLQAQDEAASPKNLTRVATGESLAWTTNAEQALAAAAAEYRPVIVVFSMPGCPWCKRLDREVLQDALIQERLEPFVRVKIDILEDRPSAQRYGVRGVPAIRFLSSDGRLTASFDGYLPAGKMEETLSSLVNAEFLRASDAKYLELIQALESGEVSEGQWPEILLALGEPRKRRPLEEAISQLKEFPRAAVVALLRDSRLGVRLGALELLEERSSDTEGFDAWDPDAPANSDVLEKLTAWAGKADGDASGERIATLTGQQLETYIRDLISNDPDRAQRALRLLESGGASVANGLTKYVNDETLPEGSRNKVREAQYLLAMPALDGVEPATLARRLVFGNLDQRLKAMAKLQEAGRDAAPILKDFLAHEDSMIREAAVDALADSGDIRVAKLFSVFLESETDENVIHSVLRGLGKIRSKTGLNLLASYLENETEDLVIAALNSIAKLRSSRVEKEVLATLKDERWRVRATGLETVIALRRRGTDSRFIAPLLEDPDQFVRFNAIKAVKELNVQGLDAQLLKLFNEDVSMMAPVLDVYVSKRGALPSEFLEAIGKAEPDIILQCLEVIGSYRTEYAAFLRRFSSHSDLDVSCAALRALAGNTTDNESLKALLSALNENHPEKTRAVLESPSIDSSLLVRANRYIGTPNVNTGRTGDPGPARTSPALATIEAFLNPGAAPAPKVRAVDVIASFLRVTGEAPATAPAPPGQSPETTNPFYAFLKKVEGIMQTSARLDERLLAARLLSKVGNREACDFIQENLGNLDAEWRELLASRLSNSPFDSILPLLAELLNDPLPAVRADAVYSAFSIAKDREGFASLVFEALSKEGTRLQPSEVLVYRLGSALRSKKTHGDVRAWAMETLARNDAPSQLKVLALASIEALWKTGDAELVLPHMESSDNYVRRAACHALGRGNLTRFLDFANQVASDESEIVRQVVPSVLINPAHRDRNWKNYLAEGIVAKDIYHDARSYHYSSRRQRSRASVPEEALEVVRRLTEDASPRVRVEAFFTLLSHQQPIDINQFVATINEFPDRKGIANRVEDYLSENYATLGKEFASLMPIAERASYGISELEKIRKHFGIEEEDADAEITFRERRSPEGPVQATFVNTASQSEETLDTIREEPIDLVYFHKTGCDECARVTDILDSIREIFPRLEVREHNIEDAESKYLNETLSRRFNVPEQIRLVAPSLFATSGYLIKDDITPSALESLLAKSASQPAEQGDNAGDPPQGEPRPSPGILEVSEEDMAEAAKAVEERYDAMTIGVVFIAGLFDGINPCAFATIIFFLSYLQVAKRTPRQILAVGAAFILAVFLTYFALGLGLSKVISGLMGLEWASKALTWLFAAVTFVIMILSFRDGILCLRGKMTEMTLQLPGFLKSRIRKTIRENSRNTRFVMAAFGSGVIISTLELACTGQVYLPTIKIMVQQGNLGAMGYLSLYNFAFIVPLIVIFALSYFGMTSDTLVSFQQKHTALVKFGLALLFLILFVFLLWGDTLVAQGAG